MNGIDILLLAVLAAVLGLAARRVWRTRKTGGCGCGCDGCLHSAGCGEKKEP